jgi:peptidoglycan/xylan/chitin deacetylase (PgdA/CDA1 family)
VEDPTAGRSRRAKPLLHAIAAPPGTALARWLARTRPPHCELRPLVGPTSLPVARVSAPVEQLEEASDGLPEGAARAEAIAVRLRRAGVELDWGPPIVFPDLPALLDLARTRGASSVEIVRADPSLLTEMHIGACFHSYWRARILRRALCRLGLPPSGRRTPARFVQVAMDAAFWAGVRSAATAAEWDRLVTSSYVVLYYHRIAGERVPGFEHLDVHPRRFEQQLRLLRLLGLRPLAPEELVEFHSEPSSTIAGRRYILAADDGIADAVAAFTRHADLDPQMFVCTGHVGSTSSWSDGAPVAGWDELRELAAAGGHVGSHSRGHVPLTELPPADLAGELGGAVRDLDEHLPRFARLLAYPHGIHDERVRKAAIEAGYRAAFTTEPGRNGAGTDAYCLRRIELKDWDGAFAVAWVALTGEPLPWVIERARRRLKGVRATRRDARAPRGTAPC